MLTSIWSALKWKRFPGFSHALRSSAGIFATVDRKTSMFRPPVSFKRTCASVETNMFEIG